jgi:hypothetical protein
LSGLVPARERPDARRDAKTIARDRLGAVFYAMRAKRRETERSLAATSISTSAKLL